MSAKQNILGKLRHSLTGTTPVPDNFDEICTEMTWSTVSSARE